MALPQLHALFLAVVWAGKNCKRLLEQIGIESMLFSWGFLAFSLWQQQAPSATSPLCKARKTHFLTLLLLFSLVRRTVGKKEHVQIKVKMKISVNVYCFSFQSSKLRQNINKAFLMLPALSQRIVWTLS